MSGYCNELHWVPITYIYVEKYETFIWILAVGTEIQAEFSVNVNFPHSESPQLSS